MARLHDAVTVLAINPLGRLPLSARNALDLAIARAVHEALHRTQRGRPSVIYKVLDAVYEHVGFEPGLAASPGLRAARKMFKAQDRAERAGDVTDLKSWTPIDFEHYGEE